MEVVNTFNKELKSIMEAKLPVSRHKMSLITKSAMKALKFYKHVVQSVEKFIAKCSCDYKVPGLYVIDAIVRQSKHQYCDKDVFVPRFMRNIVTTFIYLSQCDSKDVPSIERVLRLWQQNGVFPTDLVEALLDIIYNSSDNDKILKASTIVMKLVNEWNVQKNKPEETIETFMPPAELYNSTRLVEETPESKMEGGLIDSITKLLTKFHAETGQDVSSEIDQIQSLHQKIVEQSALLAQGQMIDVDTLSQLHQSMEELTKKAAKAAAVQQSKLAMLDDKDNNNENITDMEFVEQLQQMVDTLGQTRALQLELRQAMESSNTSTVTTADKNDQDATETDTPVKKELPNTVAPNSMHESGEITDEKEVVGFGEDKDLRVHFTNTKLASLTGSGDVDLRYMTSVMKPHNISDRNQNEFDGSSVRMRGDDAILSPTISHRSKSESKSNKRKRSRSRDKSMKKKDKKSKQDAVRSKYLPALRKNHVSVISHTVFIGHLSKHVSEAKLRALCEEYGSLLEFNMIPPRGCAFVTFEKRKSAHKAVSRLNEHKFESRELKVAWAPNKGVKDDSAMKEGWSDSVGCTYVPVDKFPASRVTEIIEGGAELDDESLTEKLRLVVDRVRSAMNQESALQDNEQKLQQHQDQQQPELVNGVGDDGGAANESKDQLVDPASAQFFATYPPPPPPPPTLIHPPPHSHHPIHPHHHIPHPHLSHPPTHVLIPPGYPGPPPPLLHPHFIHLHPHPHMHHRPPVTSNKNSNHHHHTNNNNSSEVRKENNDNSESSAANTTPNATSTTTNTTALTTTTSCNDTNSAASVNTLADNSQAAPSSNTSSSDKDASSPSTVSTSRPQLPLTNSTPPSASSTTIVRVNRPPPPHPHHHGYHMPLVPFMRPPHFMRHPHPMLRHPMAAHHHPFPQQYVPSPKLHVTSSNNNGLTNNTSSTPTTTTTTSSPSTDTNTAK